jgi:hypothetical protein
MIENQESNKFYKMATLPIQLLALGVGIQMKKYLKTEIRNEFSISLFILENLFLKLN